MDDSEFDDIYDVAQPCDIASQDPGRDDSSLPDYDSDSSDLFVDQDDRYPPDNVDDDDFDLDDLLDLDQQLDYALNEQHLSPSPASSSDLSDQDLDAEIPPAPDANLQDGRLTPHIEYRYDSDPASVVDLDEDDIDSLFGSESDLDSPQLSIADLEDLLRGEIGVAPEQLADAVQVALSPSPSPFPSIPRSPSPYSREHILLSESDSDIVEPNGNHSPASDDLFILASPSGGSASGSANTSQHSAFSLPQGGPSRRSFDRSFDRAQDREIQELEARSSQSPRPQHRRGLLPDGNGPFSGRNFPEFPRPRNRTQAQLNRRSILRRQRSILLVDDDDEAEDELIMMDIRHSRRVADAQPRPLLLQNNNVIDLTAEPDSPELAFAQPPPRMQPPRARVPAFPLAGGNPRRSNSLNHRTPSLSRSDGSILAGPSVIDLTEDSPDEAFRSPPPPYHLHAGMAMPQAQAGNNHHHNHDDGGNDDLVFQGEIARMGQAASRFRDAIGDLFSRNRRPALAHNHHNRARHNPQPAALHPDPNVEIFNMMAQLNANNPWPPDMVNLNYANNGFGGGPAGAARKPAFEAPKPARAGFNRDTRTDSSEEQVPVCASCEEELTYDADDDGPPAAKKPRTRKDREEHHFWALTECGHVYCRNCYENRMPSKKAGFESSPLGFRAADKPKKILCAVDDCDTDASTKKAWVGLFI